MSSTGYEVLALVGGKRQRKVIPAAQTEMEAKRLSGFPYSSIVKVGPARKPLIGGPVKPKPMIQVLFISSLVPGLISRRSLGDVVADLLPDYPALKGYADQAVNAGSVTDLLELMLFDPQIVALARAGEKSARLADTLRDAAEDMAETMRIKAGMGQGMGQGAVYAAMGIMILTIMSIIFGGMIKELMQPSSGMIVPINAITEILLGLHTYLTEYLWTAPIVIVLAVVFRKKIWRSLRKYPPVSLIWQFIKLRRGFDFLVGFRPMIENGIKVSDIMPVMKAGQKGETMAGYEKLERELSYGTSLSGALAADPDTWPREMIMGFKGFEESDTQGKAQVMANLKRLMILLITAYAMRIGKVVSTVGYVIVGISFMVTLLGGSMPMMAVEPVK